MGLDLPMSGESGPPLAELFSGFCGIKEGLAAIKSWLATHNPSCVRHPHGFYVALLKRNSDEEWRLHVWPKGPLVITGMPAFVHTHNCQVESLVLAGHINNTIYAVTDAVTSGSPLYEVAYGGDRYLHGTANFLKKTDRRVDLTNLQSSIVRCGERYHIELNWYHEVRVPDHITVATLVRMSERDNSPVNVVGLDGYPESIMFQRLACSALTVAEQI